MKGEKMGKRVITEFRCPVCGKTFSREKAPTGFWIPDGWVRRRDVLHIKRNDFYTYDTYEVGEYFCSLVCAKALRMDLTLFEKVKKGERHGEN
jgi:hypothetical protein